MLDLLIAPAFIIAFVQVIKKTGYVPKRLIPSLTLVVGVSALYLFGVGDVVTRLFTGCLASFTAMGMWSATRTTVE
jgi:hypothetical protein